MLTVIHMNVAAADTDTADSQNGLTGSCLGIFHFTEFNYMGRCHNLLQHKNLLSLIYLYGLGYLCTEISVYRRCLFFHLPDK